MVDETAADSTLSQDLRTELEAHWSHQSPSFTSGVRASPSLMVLSCLHSSHSSILVPPAPHPHPITNSIMRLMATTTLLWFLCLAHADTLASSLHHSKSSPAHFLDIILRPTTWNSPHKRPLDRPSSRNAIFLINLMIFTSPSHFSHERRGA